MPLDNVPVIEDQELAEAVSALTYSADTMRRLVLAACSGKDIHALVMEHMETALMAEEVIDAFLGYFGRLNGTTIN